MAAASSSVSPASGSFGRLLKSSKVVSKFDPTIPLVYTTHGGSKKRSDYGLKRALPEIKTAAIRVHSIDSQLTKLPEFSYAAKEHLFVKRFLESGVKVGGPGKERGSESIDMQRARITAVGQVPGASAWDKSSFKSVGELQDDAGVAKVKRARQKKEAIRKKLMQAAEGLAVSMDAEQSQAIASGAQGTTSSDSAQSPSDASATAAEPSPLAAKDVDLQSSSEAGTSQESLELQQQQQQHSEGKRPQRYPPNYLNMTSRQFDIFLQDLKTLRPQFLEYLRRQMATQDGPRQFLHDVYRNARTLNGDTFGAHVDAFLAEVRPATEGDGVTPLTYDPTLNAQSARDEHIGFGLTYAPPNLYMSDRETRILPARWLDRQAASKGARDGTGSMPTTVLGTITLARQADVGGEGSESTKWDADKEGVTNMGYGRSAVRVESAYVRHPAYYDTQNAQTHEEKLYGVDIDQVDNPYKRPTILDSAPVQIEVYKAEINQGSLERKRIGSRQWVAQDVSHRTNMGQAISDGNVMGMFDLPHIRPPMQGKSFTGEAQQRNRKVVGYKAMKEAASEAKKRAGGDEESGGPDVSSMIAKLESFKNPRTRTHTPK